MEEEVEDEMEDGSEVDKDVQTSETDWEVDKIKKPPI